MATNITTRIALKHAISTDWESSTLTALAGEYLFDSDRKYIKVGDGQHTWKDLTTIRLPKEAIDGLQDVDTNTIYKFENTNGILTILSADGTTTPQIWTNVLSWDLSTLIDGAVEAEATRAKAVEKDLSDAIDAHQEQYTALVEAVAANTTAIDGEVNRAKGVEEGLSATLKTVSSDYLKSDDKTALEARDTFLSGKIDAINTSLGNYALSNDVTAIKTELEGKITAETLRAEGVESGLNSRLTAAEADIDVLETGAAALSGRMTTAEAAIDALEGRMTTAEADIDAEETRATKAEAALAGRLDTIEGEGEGSIKKALADAKAYANAQDAAVSADTLAEANKYTDEKVKDLSVSLSTTVATDYVKKTDVKSTITENNKVVTEADIADIAGAMHFRGLVEKEGTESDIEAINRIIKNPKNGDVVLVGTAEYVYDGAQWKSFGDEGLYETKADATAKLTEAKTYTDTSIAALDVAEVTVGAAKTIASISETDGKISVATTDIQIAESQVTDLTSDLGTLSSMVKAEEAARIAADEALSTDYDAKIAAEVAARTAADEALDSKIANEVTARNEAISAAIETLDKADAAVAHQFVTAVSEKDGIITVSRAALTSADIPALEYDALGAAAAAETAAKAYADEKDKALHNTITSEIATAKTEAINTVVGTDADLSDADTVKGAKKYTDEKVAEVQSNSLSGVTLNGEKFNVANNVATLEISAIFCGGASL